MSESVRDYLSRIGAKGGAATGKSKSRGDAEYYRRISAKAAKARAKKRKAETVESTMVVGSINPVEVLVREPRTYRVMTDGAGKFRAGLRLGVVTHTRDGWRFIPAFQRLPSRKGWPSPEAALKGRVTNYTLEPVTAAHATS